MANSNITRETQKNRLKRQLVPAGDDFVPERKPLPKAFLPALLLVLFLCAIGGYLYFTNRHYDSLTVIWDRSTQSESGKAETFRGYEPFAKGVLQYSKDGASYVDGDIYGIPTEKVDEFAAVGTGGLALSGQEKAVVISMGTGTAFIWAEKGGEIRHLAVREDARGHGLSARLISAYLSAIGGAASNVWTGAGNEPALRAYARAGFRTDGWESVVLCHQ